MAASSDSDLLQSLLRLSREISLNSYGTPPFHRRTFAPAARKARLLSLLFEDLLRHHHPIPSPAALCLREVLLLLHRFKALLADLSSHSRCRLLLHSDSLSSRFHDLSLDLSSLLGLLPLHDLSVSDDVRDVVSLLRRQCRRPAPLPDSRLRSDVLSTIRDLERGLAPDRALLESVFARLGLDSSHDCRDEIDSLESDATPSMVALAGLLRYAKCVVFGASTPRRETPHPDSPSCAADPSVPADFRCPITLDLMRDPVVVATGQTYDRESITRWIAAGHATCPKTGQDLAHTNVIPNRALRNLIARWCREQNLPYDGAAAAAGGGGGDTSPRVGEVNKAALEAARMTASFLVQKLAASPSAEAANRVAHELRLLAKSGSENRAFVAEAGAIPLLIPLLTSDDPDLQVNAVTTLLNLSILEANKKRIMHADGGIDGVVRVLASGATWRARENAAATLFSLSSVHAYCRRLGRYPLVAESLVELVRAGPVSTKKDALAAMLSLARDRENIARLVERGAVEVALEAAGGVEVSDEAAAVLAAVTKRGGAAAVVAAEGAVSKMVQMMRHGSDWARECAAATLLVVCRKAGGAAVEELAGTPGIECLIWDLMASGTERTKRKAASLGRMCRRWVASAEAADLTARLSTMDMMS